MSGSSTLSWAPAAAYWQPPRGYRDTIRVRGYGIDPSARFGRAYWMGVPSYRRLYDPALAGLGQLPTPASLQARVQAEVGEFLGARQQIDQMLRRASTADELAGVQSLQLEQSTLEAQLPDMLNAARAIREGQYNLTLGAQLAAFAVRLEDHLTQVRAMARHFGLAVAGAAGAGIARLGLSGMTIAGLVFGGFVVMAMARRRR